MKASHARIAVIQAEPKLMDKESALNKIREATAIAASQGANVVVFPETFVPGYPRGLSFGARVGSRSEEGRSDWHRYWSNAVEIPGPDTELLCDTARESAVYLIVGIVERDREFGGGTLYNTLLYVSPEGEVLGKHRKLMPTGSERLLWGQGDGSTLTVIDTPYGRIGGLICWENYMPLARMAMYAQGIDILVTPTADARETWQSTLRHIACEGRCFVVSCNQYATKMSYPTDLGGYGEIEAGPEVLCEGGSAIVGPMGEYIAGPLYGKEGMLIADLELAAVARSRFDFDPVGHYSRPDVFQLTVRTGKREIVVRSD
ncbi:carbon-nitrogen hydrolase family protein [Cohnella boryungensis]|uniref:Carbon-nitrogen hydrolase family protein n=1 Tax=Cohnella boryungensis TaxID=768479 RepID=A0ABV8SJZ3_9BACL